MSRVAAQGKERRGMHGPFRRVELSAHGPPVVVLQSLKGAMTLGTPVVVGRPRIEIQQDAMHWTPTTDPR